MIDKEQQVSVQDSQPHTHVNEHGGLVKCYHRCRNALTDYGFWVGLTIGYPLEHALYDHVYPFTLIRDLLHTVAH